MLPVNVFEPAVCFDIFCIVRVYIATGEITTATRSKISRPIFARAKALTLLLDYAPYKVLASAADGRLAWKRKGIAVMLRMSATTHSSG